MIMLFLCAGTRLAALLASAATSARAASACTGRGRGEERGGAFTCTAATLPRRVCEPGKPMQYYTNTLAWLAWPGPLAVPRLFASLQ